MSKGLTSGYIPMGATLVAPHVAEVFKGRPEGAFLHGHTYGGHPLAAAAGRQVLSRVVEGRMWESAERQGNRLLAGLRALSHHRYYWDVRGRGLLTGLEIVRDSTTGQMFSNPIAAGNRLRILCRELGMVSLILHPGNILFIAPAFVVTDDEIDRMVAIVDEALTIMEKEDIDY
jgi:adenosylmethionine-8-amino-7-oxononanoate aminotransferase